MSEKTCEVCGLGCAHATLRGRVKVGWRPGHGKDDRVHRLLVSAVSATSAPETRRWLDRAEKMGATAQTLDSLRRCEPLLSTHDEQRHFHAGCRPADIGECPCCGAWHHDTEPTAGPGLPCCGAGATPTGKPTKAQLNAHQIACLSARLRGKDQKPQLADRRAEALELERILRTTQAELALRTAALDKEEPNG